MGIKIANNVQGVLASAITSGQTTGITLTTGHGSRFPALGVGDYFYATLASQDGDEEIVKVTARSSDELTMERGAESTTPTQFQSGASLEMRVTAGSLQDAAQYYGNLGATAGLAALQSQVDTLDTTLTTALDAEITLRASLTDDLDNRVLALENTVDTTTTGLVDRVTALEGGTSGDLAAIIDRLDTAEADILTNNTTLTAAISSEVSTRASQNIAISNTVTSLTAVVNTKAATFAQTSAPTAGAVGDIWMDTDDNNKLYRWNGTAWVALDDQRIIANAAAIVTEASARATADTAIANTVTSLTATVATKNITFAQTSAPTANAVGDLWMDTDDSNKIYRWNGSSWVLLADARIAVNEASIVTEQSVRASADSAMASDISTLTTNYGTLSATVSTHASALAGAGGAQALLAFDVNTGTNVASLRLFSTSGGTWNGSAITLTADQITLNGNVIINGTLTYQSMSANEITAGGIDEVDASLSLTTSWQDAASVTVTVPGGAEVDLMWSAALLGLATNSSHLGGTAYVRIVRDSTVIYSSTPVGTIQAYEGTAEYDSPSGFVLGDLYQSKLLTTHVAGMDGDAPAAGTYTYKVQFMRDASTSWQVSMRRLKYTLRKR